MTFFLAKEMRLIECSNDFKMETGKEIHWAFVCGRSATSEIIKKFSLNIT